MKLSDRIRSRVAQTLNLKSATSASDQIRTYISHGLRVIGTPVARLIFGSDTFVTRVGGPIRRRLNTRIGRIAGVAGFSVTAIIAIAFIWMVVSVGLLSSVASIAVIGADVRDVQQGRTTIQPGYTLSTIFIENSGFIPRVNRLRYEKYGQGDTPLDLMFDGRLQAVAGDHTVQMVAMGEPSTVAPDGVSVTERMAQANITCQKRYTTDPYYWDNKETNKSGETFTNTEPAVIVGSYHYGLDKQYTLSNEWSPLADGTDMPDKEIEMGEPARVVHLEGLNPFKTYEAEESSYYDSGTVTKDYPFYDMGADIGGLAPWHPDLLKFIQYTSEDVMNNPAARAKLMNPKYSHYGFSFRVANDRTVYYTIVLC